MTAPPPLAFGAAGAKTFGSANEAVRETFRLVSGLIDFDFKRNAPFYYRTASADLNGLTVTAFSSSPGRIHVGPRPKPVLMMALNGTSRLQVDGQSYRLEPKRDALFIPQGVNTHAQCDDRSVVMMSFDLARLQKTAKKMLGPLWDNRILSVFNDPREVSLQSGSFSHDQNFRGLFSLTDAYGENHAFRDLVGLDELYYRAAIMAMLPVQFPERGGVKA